MHRLAEAISQYRKDNRWSRPAFVEAKGLEVHPQALYRWETTGAIPSASVPDLLDSIEATPTVAREALADALGVTDEEVSAILPGRRDDRFDGLVSMVSSVANVTREEASAWLQRAIRKA